MRPRETIRGTRLDLRDYLQIMRRNWILLTSLTLVGIFVGGAVSVLLKPTYTASTQLFVAIQSSGSVSELQQGNTFSQARVQSYVKTAETPIVLQPAIDELGLATTAAELASRVVVTADLNTVLINVSVSDPSPVQAAAIAEAVANSLIRAIDTLERPKTGNTSPVSLSVITPAVAPSAPSAPNTRLNLLLGLLLGFIAGAVAALLRTTLDYRVIGEPEIRRVTDKPVLGGIAFESDVARKPLLTQSAPQSPRAESFRQLRTNLQFANVAGEAKTVLLTSSLPGEGKSTTAINLALALAQAGQSVCLVDADLRRPMVGDYLGLDRSAGLTTALVGSHHVKDLLQPWGNDDLYVLTSGQIPPNPSELLGSQAMKSLVGDLEEIFDTVIIDAPPLLPVTDAAVLAQHVGGVALVVGSKKVKLHDLERSLNALELVEANLLGLVLNHMPARGRDSYSYSYATSDSPINEGSPKSKLTRRTKSGRLAASEPDEHSEMDRPAAVFPGRRIDVEN